MTYYVSWNLHTICIVWRRHRRSACSTCARTATLYTTQITPQFCFMSTSFIFLFYKWCHLPIYGLAVVKPWITPRGVEALHRRVKSSGVPKMADQLNNGMVCSLNKALNVTYERRVRTHILSKSMFWSKCCFFLRNKPIPLLNWSGVL